jgi:hypothetical protein
MNIRATLLLLTLAASAHPALAQNVTSETEAVKQTVLTFFDGMRRGDSTLVRHTLAPGAVFHGLVLVGKPGQPVALHTESISDLLEGVGTPHPEVWDERVQIRAHTH